MKENNLNRPTERNYGIDLFRIVSMMMIVTLHVLGHGADIWSLDYGTARYDVLWLFEITAFCAVNCYGLISGYVGINSNYRASNLVSLWLQVAFYSVSITVIFKIMYPDSVSKFDFISAIFPVLSNRYWYFTSYFLLFLFVPVLNYVVEHMSKVKMGIVLFAFVFCVSVLSPIYVSFFCVDSFKLSGGYSAWWLITLYMLGAYLSKHRILHNVNLKWLVLVFALSTLLTWSSKVLLPIIENHLFGEVRYADLLVNYTSITVLVSAVSLLLVFVRLEIGRLLKRIIVFLSPLCFSVYLIHDNIYIRKAIIYGRFNFLQSMDIPLMVLCIIGCVVGIYLLCSLLDLIRFWSFKILKVKYHLSIIEDRIKNKLYQKIGID